MFLTQKCITSYKDNNPLFLFIQRNIPQKCGSTRNPRHGHSHPLIRLLSPRSLAYLCHPAFPYSTSQITLLSHSLTKEEDESLGTSYKIPLPHVSNFSKSQVKRHQSQILMPHRRHSPSLALTNEWCMHFELRTNSKIHFLFCWELVETEKLSRRRSLTEQRYGDGGTVAFNLSKD